MSASVISLDESTGYLDVIIGPMYSGKTNRLLNELILFATMGASVLYLNSDKDNRTDEPFSTHNPLIQTIGEIKGKKINELYDAYEDCKQAQIIGIDEAQFFSNLKSFVLDMVEKEGKRVIVTGLSGNFKREMFGEILQLIPYCDRITKLNSLCMGCSTQRKIKDAHFSYRLTEENSEILVGGKSKYVPLCRSCYIKNK